MDNKIQNFRFISFFFIFLEEKKKNYVNVDLNLQLYHLY